MCGDSTNSTPSTARNALATVLALLPERLLSGAVAAHHALGPLHLMPICLLLMAQVTCKASPTAWETQPPVNNNPTACCTVTHLVNCKPLVTISYRLSAVPASHQTNCST